MKVKYSPCKHNIDTQISIVDQNIIRIDTDVYEFDDASVYWDEIYEQTEGKIHEAHRQDGELYLTIRRFYSESCNEWDTGDYQ